MNTQLLEQLRKIESKIYNETDEFVDLRGMALRKGVNEKKLQEMVNKNNVKGIVKLLEGNSRGTSIKEDWDDAAWHDTADQEQTDQPDYIPENNPEWTSKESTPAMDAYLDDVFDYISNEPKRDFVGKMLWQDVSTLHELVPEMDEQDANKLEKYFDDYDIFLYRTDDDVFIINPLADDGYGIKGVNNFIEEMKIQMEETEKVESESDIEESLSKPKKKELKEELDKATLYRLKAELEDAFYNKCINDKHWGFSTKENAQRFLDPQFVITKDGNISIFADFGDYEAQRDMAEELDAVLHQYVEDVYFDDVASGHIKADFHEEPQEWEIEHQTWGTPIKNYRFRGTHGQAVNDMWKNRPADSSSYSITKVKESVESEKPFKMRFYKLEGSDKGNLDHEEFFDTKEQAIDRYNQVFKKELFSLNPTVWEMRDGDWKRLMNHEIVKESLNESVYTENGFANRKEYLNSLADDFGVDIQTVYDLASILGPDEDFDALVSELEDVAYNSDDFIETDEDDEEYEDKQFSLCSYYDDKFRGLEDCIDLNYGDDPDIEDWIWEKCSKGHWVRVRDWSNGLDISYRPVEEGDIDTSDLMVKETGIMGLPLGAWQKTE